MKTKKTKIFVPKFRLIFYLKGKRIKSINTKKLKRIISNIKGYGTSFRWDKAFLKFRYDEDSTNEGYYFNLKELESAYRCFKEILSEYTKEIL